MKRIIWLAMCMMTPVTLMGQSAQEIADALPAPELDTVNKRLVAPVVEGAVVELAGTDYQQIITKEGMVRPVISNVPVEVFFRVIKDGEEALSRDFEVPVTADVVPGNPKPQVIPAILQWQGGKGEWKPGDVICVSWSDRDKAELFKAELEAMMGVQVKVLEEGSEMTADISFREAEGESKESLGEEGYELHIATDGVEVVGGGEKGMWWATRSLLQIFKTQGGKLPCGKAVDFPRYGLRGFILDIARTHYTLAELRDVINTMSWYKMNDLHLVINNNFIFHEAYVDAGRDPFKESYSSFRLESVMKGEDGHPLTSTDVSYSKRDFRALIDYAKVRGVDVVPELDTPSHALALTRIRPDLMYKGPMKRHDKRRCEMLDAANPETLTFVEKCFDEYLLKDPDLGRAVFEGCTVHVGADEFFGAAEDYRKYTDAILRYVVSRGYQPRVWGSQSSKPGKTPVLAKGVQMNLWNTTWQRAWEAIDLGYDVINTNDVYLYIVPFADYYRMDENLDWLYENWQPHMMYQEQLPAGHPQLLGAAFAVWNDVTDLRHTGYGMYDIWHIISDSMDVLAQKMWGTPQPPDTYEEHRKLAKSIGFAPLINPLFVWKKKDPVEIRPDSIPQQIGLPALGPDYHLTMEVELTEAPEGEEQVLLSSPEGELLGVMKDGSIGFRRADTMEFSYDAKLPIGKTVRLELIGTEGYTKLLIDGQPVSKMQLDNYVNADEGFHKRTKGLRSTFILPLQTLGRHFHGKINLLRVEQ